MSHLGLEVTEVTRVSTGTRRGRGGGTDSVLLHLACLTASQICLLGEVKPAFPFRQVPDPSRNPSTTLHRVPHAETDSWGGGEGGGGLAGGRDSAGQPCTRASECIRMGVCSNH